MPLLHHLSEGFRYPFRDEKWLQKLWPLPVIALLPVVGLISVILLKGWRFEMVRNIAHDNMELPAFDPIIMAKRGLILWLVMTGHIFIPGVLCALLGLATPLGLVMDIYEMIVNGVDVWFKENASDWALTLTIYFTWAIISFPVFQMGMIRYALTGNWKSMLNAPLNFMLFVRNIHYFILFYGYWLIISLGILLIDVLFAMTGIGVFFIPALTLCLYYVTTAYDLGRLAKKMNARNIQLAQADYSVISSS